MNEARLKVILLRHTPAPEEAVAMAAKLCYSPSHIDSLRQKISSEDQRAFVKKLMEVGHMTPVEHASFTFAVEGISRACSHQVVRHRLASYSQQSQRYVSEEKGFRYIMPPSIREDKELRQYFEKVMEFSQHIYNTIVQRLNRKGITGEAANQDARFVLPNAAETKLMVTMNARELLHFFRLRCCNRSQWEVRGLAEEMLRLVKRVSPVIFDKAGPACIVGPCPEGEYSCGKASEVRKKYGISPKARRFEPKRAEKPSPSAEASRTVTAPGEVRGKRGRKKRPAQGEPGKAPQRPRAGVSQAVARAGRKKRVRE